MSSKLYPRLAAVNIGKNKKLYIPYILSSVITIAMFYIMGSVDDNGGLKEMRGAEYLESMTLIGVIVIAVFSCIFLIYTNSYIIKQRKKEFGLYSVLGMEKKHIALIMLYETVYTFFICVIGGLLFGIIFDKLTYLMLCKLFSFEVRLGFHISLNGIFYTFITFGIIFLVNLVFNIIRIYRINPIELLHGGSVGEKEPKTKIISAILGIIFLAAGYAIAIVTKNPLNAINLFLVAVLCVIFGTFLLFMSGSIAFLKALKKNKSYYYSKKHFNSVSGMIYRMKQNAAGLSNICILSTMVLVTVSTTFSLYLGSEDSLKNRYPRDVMLNYYDYTYDEDGENPVFYSGRAEIVMKELENISKKEKIYIIDLRKSEFVSFRVGFDGSAINPNYSKSEEASYMFYFVTLKNYAELTGETIKLDDDEIIVFTSGDKLIGDSINILGKDYRVVKSMDSGSELHKIQYLTNTGGYILSNDNYIVVSDMSELMRISKAYPNGNAYDSLMYFDLSGTNEEKIQDVKVIRNYLDKSGIEFDLESKDESREDFYTLNGSFLFLGVFLGTLFLVVTVMIIYYKQITEGYSDRERFIIMQNVGMSRQEVKQTIHSQVLTVFFLPLITACIHLCFSFPIVSKLLSMFGLVNKTIFIISIAVTAAVFALIYMIVYLLTARTYYRIVSK